MTEQQRQPESTVLEDEAYEPPEVSDFGALVELTAGGNGPLSDVMGFNNATPSSGGS